MNIANLFETQRMLDVEIEKKHPTAPHEERMYKVNLALLVELGELANEQRSWKFWSNDQKPRTVYQTTCQQSEATHYYCDNCKKEIALGEGVAHSHECEWMLYPMKSKNPLLEEFVDCLHFILSIGNFLDYSHIKFTVGRLYREETIEEQFLMVFDYAVRMQHDDYYYDLVQSFMHLGEMLGFTWEQVTDAYMKKNAINHQRQAEGY